MSSTQTNIVIPHYLFPAYSITWSMLVRPIPVRYEHVYGPTAKAWEHVQQRLGMEGTILN